MAHLTVWLTTEASERLTRRAERLRMRPEDLSRQIIEAALRDEPPPKQSARDVLSLAGLLAEPSDLTMDESDEEISLDEVRRALTVSGGPTLSDMVLDQRGPKD